MGHAAAPVAGAQAGSLKLKTVFRNARVLVMDAADTELATATVVVEGDCISRVIGPGDTDTDSGAADRQIDARGHLLLPGLINEIGRAHV